MPPNKALRRHAFLENRSTFLLRTFHRTVVWNDRDTTVPLTERSKGGSQAHLSILLASFEQARVARLAVSGPPDACRAPKRIPRASRRTLSLGVELIREVSSGSTRRPRIDYQLLSELGRQFGIAAQRATPRRRLRRRRARKGTAAAWISSPATRRSSALHRLALRPARVAG
jgi:hypothetical protein